MKMPSVRSFSVRPAALCPRRCAPFVVAAGALLAIAGCSARDPAAPAMTGDDLGKLSIVLSAASSTLGGFQIDIESLQGSKDGGKVASRFVSSTVGGPPETVFALSPGEYSVTATPDLSPGLPDPSCSAANARATVETGKSTAVVMVARCRAPGTGGLDVRVGTNTEPEVTGVVLTPSRAVNPCETLTLSATARDADGDPITFRFAAESAGASAAPGAVPFVLEPVGDHVAFTASTVGEFLITVQACDTLGCGSLPVPVHVVGPPVGSCAVSCDDQDPCTTDAPSTGGGCTHGAIADGALCSGGNLRVKLLGFNDFHGHLDTDLRVGGRLVGGAAVLASYLEQAQAGIEDQTILVHAGDLVGASPADSALLQDEPSIQLLNLIGNSSCAYGDNRNAACNVVGTLGNHEFDEGKGELLRLLGGGNFAEGPFLEDPWRGARVPYVSANVRDVVTHETLVPPYVVKMVRGIPVAFIGAVLRGTPSIVTPTGVAGLEFLDEPTAINSYVSELKAQGVRAIVVTIHQGGFQASYTGATRATAALSSGPEIADIVNRLDDEVDVVVSGHTHAFTNAYVPNAHGKAILVTQAFSAGTAYDDIDLLIDPVTHDVVTKTAQIVTTYADAGPGLTPDPTVAAMVRAADGRVEPLVSRVVGSLTTPLTRAQSAAGESTLGDLIADAQREAMGTAFAFMNPGGIRADVAAGSTTWGQLFAIQPFGNSLVRMNLSGSQIYALLEQQWLGQTSPRILQISGLSYTWDPALPIGGRVVEVRSAGVAIDRAAMYTVTCNNFLAAGGDGFGIFTSGTDQVGGAIDLDALVEYVEAHAPVGLPGGGRIRTP
jgi:5'-nucleotidase